MSVVTGAYYFTLACALFHITYFMLVSTLFRLFLYCCSCCHKLLLYPGDSTSSLWKGVGGNWFALVQLLQTNVVAVIR